MPKILSILNSKGGCAKTSTAVHLAACLKQRGYSPIVIDADETQGASLWAAKGDGLGFPVTPIQMGRKSARAFRDEITDAAKAADASLILVDTPPQLADVSRVTALFSDLVLIPLSPSELDYWGAETALDFVADAQEARGGLPDVMAVPSRVTNTVLARSILDGLKARDVAISPAISQRVAVAECVSMGTTIAEYAGTSRSGQEFLALADAVLGRLFGDQQLEAA